MKLQDTLSLLAFIFSSSDVLDTSLDEGVLQQALIEALLDFLKWIDKGHHVDPFAAMIIRLAQQSVSTPIKNDLQSCLLDLNENNMHAYSTRITSPISDKGREISEEEGEIHCENFVKSLFDKLKKREKKTVFYRTGFVGAPSHYMVCKLSVSAGGIFVDSINGGAGAETYNQAKISLEKQEYFPVLRLFIRNPYNEKELIKWLASLERFNLRHGFAVKGCKDYDEYDFYETLLSSVNGLDAIIVPVEGLSTLTQLQRGKSCAVRTTLKVVQHLFSNKEAYRLFKLTFRLYLYSMVMHDHKALETLEKAKAGSIDFLIKGLANLARMFDPELRIQDKNYWALKKETLEALLFQVDKWKKSLSQIPRDTAYYIKEKHTEVDRSIAVKEAGFYNRPLAPLTQKITYGKKGGIKKSLPTDFYEAVCTIESNLTLLQQSNARFCAEVENLCITFTHSKSPLVRTANFDLLARLSKLYEAYSTRKKKLTPRSIIIYLNFIYLAARLSEEGCFCYNDAKLNCSSIYGDRLSLFAQSLASSPFLCTDDPRLDGMLSIMAVFFRANSPKGRPTPEEVLTYYLSLFKGCSEEEQKNLKKYWEEYAPSSGLLIGMEGLPISGEQYPYLLYLIEAHERDEKKIKNTPQLDEIFSKQLSLEKFMSTILQKIAMKGLLGGPKFSIDYHELSPSIDVQYLKPDQATLNVVSMLYELTKIRLYQLFLKPDLLFDPVFAGVSDKKIQAIVTNNADGQGLHSNEVAVRLNEPLYSPETVDDKNDRRSNSYPALEPLSSLEQVYARLAYILISPSSQIVALLDTLCDYPEWLNSVEFQWSNLLTVRQPNARLPACASLKAVFPLLDKLWACNQSHFDKLWFVLQLAAKISNYAVWAQSEGLATIDDQVQELLGEWQTKFLEVLNKKKYTVGLAEQRQLIKLELETLLTLAKTRSISSQRETQLVECYLMLYFLPQSTKEKLSVIEAEYLETLCLSVADYLTTRDADKVFSLPDINEIFLKNKDYFHVPFDDVQFSKGTIDKSTITYLSVDKCELIIQLEERQITYNSRRLCYLPNSIILSPEYQENCGKDLTPLAEGGTIIIDNREVDCFRWTSPASQMSYFVSLDQQTNAMDFQFKRNEKWFTYLVPSANQIKKLPFSHFCFAHSPPKCLDDPDFRVSLHDDPQNLQWFITDLKKPDKILYSYQKDQLHNDKGELVALYSAEWQSLFNKLPDFLTRIEAKAFIQVIESREKHLVWELIRHKMRFVFDKKTNCYQTEDGKYSVIQSPPLHNQLQLRTGIFLQDNDTQQCCYLVAHQKFKLLKKNDNIGEGDPKNKIPAGVRYAIYHDLLGDFNNETAKLFLWPIVNGRLITSSLETYYLVYLYSVYDNTLGELTYSNLLDAFELLNSIQPLGSLEEVEALLWIINDIPTGTGTSATIAIQLLACYKMTQIEERVPLSSQKKKAFLEKCIKIYQNHCNLLNNIPEELRLTSFQEMTLLSFLNTQIETLPTFIQIRYLDCFGYKNQGFDEGLTSTATEIPVLNAGALVQLTSQLPYNYQISFKSYPLSLSALQKMLCSLSPTAETTAIYSYLSCCFNLARLSPQEREQCLSPDAKSRIRWFCQTVVGTYSLRLSLAGKPADRNLIGLYLIANLLWIFLHLDDLSAEVIHTQLQQKDPPIDTIGSFVNCIHDSKLLPQEIAPIPINKLSRYQILHEEKPKLAKNKINVESVAIPNYSIFKGSEFIGLQNELDKIDKEFNLKINEQRNALEGLQDLPLEKRTVLSTEIGNALCLLEKEREDCYLEHFEKWLDRYPIHWDTYLMRVRAQLKQEKEKITREMEDIFHSRSRTYHNRIKEISAIKKRPSIDALIKKFIDPAYEDYLTWGFSQDQVALIEEKIAQFFAINDANVRFSRFEKILQEKGWVTLEAEERFGRVLAKRITGVPTSTQQLLTEKYPGGAITTGTLVPTVDPRKRSNRETDLKLLRYLSSKNEASRRYDAVFQYMNQIAFYPEQAAILRTLLEKNLIKETIFYLLQLGTGLGKTKALMPMMASLLADGDSLVVMQVLPESLLMNYNDLRRISYTSFQQELSLFQFDRNASSSTSKASLRKTYEMLVATRKNKGYVISTPHTTGSLELFYLSLLEEERNTPDYSERKGWVKKILKSSTSKSVGIFDEASKAFDPTKELCFAIGSSKQGLEESDIATITDLYTWLARTGKKMPTINSSQETQDKKASNGLIDFINPKRGVFLESEINDYLDQRIDLLIESIANEKEPAPYWIRELLVYPLTTTQLKAYLKGETTTEDDIYHHLERYPLIKRKWILLRQEFKSFLPFNFSRKLYEHYGPPKRNAPNDVAIPWENDPTDDIFANVFIAANATCQQILWEGVSVDYFLTTIEEWQRLAEIEKRQNPGGESTHMEKIYHLFFSQAPHYCPLLELNLKNTEKIMPFYNEIRFNLDFIQEIQKRMLEKIRAAGGLLHHNAINTASAFESNILITATPRPEIFPMGIEDDLERTATTQALFINKLKLENPPIKAIVTIDTDLLIQECLKLQPDCFGFIDTGNRFRGTPGIPYQNVACLIAKALKFINVKRQEDKRIHYILFFKENAFYVWDANGSENQTPIPLSGTDTKTLDSELKCTLKNRFIVFDKQRVEGTDIEMPEDATVIQFIDTKITTISEFQQGSGRRRKDSQRLVLIVDEVAQNNLPLKQLTDLLSKNQYKVTQDVAFQTAKRQIADLFRRQILDDLLNEDDCKMEELLFDEAKKVFFIQNSSCDVSELYQQKPALIKTKEDLNNYRERLYKHFLDLGHYSSKSMKAVKKKAAELDARAQAVCQKASLICAEEQLSSPADKQRSITLKLQTELRQELTMKLLPDGVRLNAPKVDWVNRIINMQGNIPSEWRLINDLMKPFHLNGSFSSNFYASRDFLFAHKMMEQSQTIFNAYNKPPLIVFFMLVETQVIATLICGEEAEAAFNTILGCPIKPSTPLWLATLGGNSFPDGSKPSLDEAQQDQYEQLLEQARFLGNIRKLVDNPLGNFCASDDSSLPLKIDFQKKVAPYTGANPEFVEQFENQCSNIEDIIEDWATGANQLIAYKKERGAASSNRVDLRLQAIVECLEKIKSDPMAEQPTLQSNLSYFDNVLVDSYRCTLCFIVHLTRAESTNNYHEAVEYFIQHHNKIASTYQAYDFSSRVSDELARKFLIALVKSRYAHNKLALMDKKIQGLIKNAFGENSDLIKRLIIKRLQLWNYEGDPATSNRILIHILSQTIEALDAVDKTINTLLAKISQFIQNEKRFISTISTLVAYGYTEEDLNWLYLYEGKDSKKNNQLLLAITTRVIVLKLTTNELGDRPAFKDLVERYYRELQPDIDALPQGEKSLAAYVAFHIGNPKVKDLANKTLLISIINDLILAGYAEHIKQEDPLLLAIITVAMSSKVRQVVDGRAIAQCYEQLQPDIALLSKTEGLLEVYVAFYAGYSHILQEFTKDPESKTLLISTIALLASSGYKEYTEQDSRLLLVIITVAMSSKARQVVDGRAIAQCYEQLQPDIALLSKTEGLLEVYVAFYAGYSHVRQEFTKDPESKTLLISTIALLASSGYKEYTEQDSRLLLVIITKMMSTKAHETRDIGTQCDLIKTYYQSLRPDINELSQQKGLLETYTALYVNNPEIRAFTKDLESKTLLMSTIDFLVKCGEGKTLEQGTRLLLAVITKARSLKTQKIVESWTIAKYYQELDLQLEIGSLPQTEGVLEAYVALFMGNPIIRVALADDLASSQRLISIINDLILAGYAEHIEQEDPLLLAIITALMSSDRQQVVDGRAIAQCYEQLQPDIALLSKTEGLLEVYVAFYVNYSHILQEFTKDPESQTLLISIIGRLVASGYEKSWGSPDSRLLLVIITKVMSIKRQETRDIGTLSDLIKEYYQSLRPDIHELSQPEELLRIYVAFYVSNEGIRELTEDSASKKLLISIITALIPLGYTEYTEQDVLLLVIITQVMSSKTKVLSEGTALNELIARYYSELQPDIALLSKTEGLLEAYVAFYAGYSHILQEFTKDPGSKTLLISTIALLASSGYKEYTEQDSRLLLVITTKMMSIKIKRPVFSDGPQLNALIAKHYKMLQPDIALLSKTEELLKAYVSAYIDNPNIREFIKKPASKVLLISTIDHLVSDGYTGENSQFLLLITEVMLSKTQKIVDAQAIAACFQQLQPDIELLYKIENLSETHDLLEVYVAFYAGYSHILQEFTKDPESKTLLIWTIALLASSGYKEYTEQDSRLLLVIITKMMSTKAHETRDIDTQCDLIQCDLIKTYYQGLQPDINELSQPEGLLDAYVTLYDNPVVRKFIEDRDPRSKSLCIDTVSRLVSLGYTSEEIRDLFAEKEDIAVRLLFLIVRHLDPKEIGKQEQLGSLLKKYCKNNAVKFYVSLSEKDYEFGDVQECCLTLFIENASFQKMSENPQVQSAFARAINHLFYYGYNQRDIRAFFPKDIAKINLLLLVTRAVSAKRIQQNAGKALINACMGSQLLRSSVEKSSSDIEKEIICTSFIENSQGFEQNQKIKEELFSRSEILRQLGKDTLFQEMFSHAITTLSLYDVSAERVIKLFSDRKSLEINLLVLAIDALSRTNSKIEDPLLLITQCVENKTLRSYINKLPQNDGVTILDTTAKIYVDLFINNPSFSSEQFENCMACYDLWQKELNNTSTTAQLFALPLDWLLKDFVGKCEAIDREEIRELCNMKNETKDHDLFSKRFHLFYKNLFPIINKDIAHLMSYMAGKPMLTNQDKYELPLIFGGKSPEDMKKMIIDQVKLNQDSWKDESVSHYEHGSAPHNLK